MLNHQPADGTPVVLSNPSIALYTQHQLTPSNVGSITGHHDGGDVTVTWDNGAVVQMRPDELDRTYVEHTFTLTVRTLDGAGAAAEDIYEALSRELTADATITLKQEEPNAHLR
jgi:hypothetical protein